VVPERGGTPFRQIFLSRNGAPVNIVDHSRNDDAAAFRQINSYYNKKAVLPQGNRAMPQVFFSVEVRQQHSLQV